MPKTFENHYLSLLSSTFPNNHPGKVDEGNLRHCIPKRVAEIVM